MHITSCMRILCSILRQQINIQSVNDVKEATLEALKRPSQFSLAPPKAIKSTLNANANKPKPSTVKATIATITANYLIEQKILSQVFPFYLTARQI